MFHTLIVIWIFLGWITWLHYAAKDNQKWIEEIQKGNLTFDRLVLGWFLTIILWPIAIFNNEVRK